jgi:hypothetical protein
MLDRFRKMFGSQDRAQTEAERRMDVIHGPEKKPLYPGLLAKRLLAYPPNIPRHVGPAESLTEQQVDENLAAFMAGRAERVRIFSALLCEYGVDVAPLFDPRVAPAPVIDEIENFLANYLPERKDLPPHASLVNAPQALYATSSRSGSEIVFSLAADYAIVLGEAIIIHKPKWFWGVDRDPENGPHFPDGGMEHYRHIVLLTKARKDWPARVSDLEAQTLGVIYQLRSRSPVKPHTSWWLNGVIAEEDYGPPE